MTHTVIRAGTMNELYWREGDWTFIDLGFSRAAKTCGFLHVPAEPSDEDSPGAVLLTFGELTKRVVALVQRRGPPLHLVLEAPLSAAFGGADDGSPLGRSVERQANKTRYWYVGLGCSVLVASLYFVKAVLDAKPVREVRLFEGFVSFKDASNPSNYIEDVKKMKAVVWSGGLRGGTFCEPAPLEGHHDAHLSSTLALLGLDLCPPPIVQVYALTPPATPQS